MEQRCKESMNINRVLSSIRWDSDREVLLYLYKTLVMSKMDYGCVVYSSARSSRLKALDLIEFSGLRLPVSLGTFSTIQFCHYVVKQESRHSIIVADS
nr:unnamed protein product [Callosobruchus analis]